MRRGGGADPGRAADRAAFLASARGRGLTGRLISAVHDAWDTWGPDDIRRIMAGSSFTLRRLDSHTLGPLLDPLQTADRRPAGDRPPGPRAAGPGGGRRAWGADVTAICFDADGTLYHSDLTAVDLWRMFCAERGVEASGDEVSAALGEISARFGERRSRLRELKLASPSEAAVLEEVYWAGDAGAPGPCAVRRGHPALVERDRPRGGRALPGHAALDTLAERGLRLGVFSNRPADIRPTLARLGFASRFAWVRSAWDAGFAKPDPRVFAAAAAALGVARDALVYVGDSMAEDVLGARSSGCRPVLIDRGGARGGGAGSPVIRSLAELPGTLGW